MVSRLAAILAVAVALQGGPAPRELQQGDQSNVDSPREVVVRTQAEWETLWRQHNPDAARPRVDFRADMVIAVFLGTRPTPGYAVHVASITDIGKGLVVRYRESKPAPGGLALQVLTFPYHMVLTPQRPGPVTFELVD